MADRSVKQINASRIFTFHGIFPSSDDLISEDRATSSMYLTSRTGRAVDAQCHSLPRKSRAAFPESRPARQQSELEKRQHDKSRCSVKDVLMEEMTTIERNTGNRTKPKRERQGNRVQPYDSAHRSTRVTKRYRRGRDHRRTQRNRSDLLSNQMDHGDKAQCRSSIASR